MTIKQMVWNVAAIVFLFIILGFDLKACDMTDIEEDQIIIEVASL